MLDLILLATVSVFVVYRLIKTLGKAEEGESIRVGSIVDLFKKETKQVQDADFEVVPAEEAPLSDNIRAVFEELRKVEKHCNAKTFIDGVREAFEMIIDAVNYYYVDVLKELLEFKLYRNFISELGKRHGPGPEYEATLVKINDVKILDAYIKNEKAYIKVKIDSEQIILMKDKEGKVTSGKTDEVLQVSDIWAFCKTIKGTDYWKLVEVNSK